MSLSNHNKTAPPPLVAVPIYILLPLIHIVVYKMALCYSMKVNEAINRRTDREASMGRNDGRVVIFLYNLYTLFFYPLAIFMASFWALEIKFSFPFRHGKGMPIAVLIVFLPEVILGLSWGLNNTFGGRIFTILSSIAAGWILHKLFHWYFMAETYAPITYYTENIMLVSGIIWTIVIEFNQALRDHLLLYPQDKWLVPNAEDDTENGYWHGLWLVLFWSAVAFMFLEIFGIIH